MTQVVLGREMSDGREVALSLDARALGTYVPGKTGMGKSTLFLNMIVQDMVAGRGVALIDPDHDLVADLLPRIPAHRRDDVVLLDLLDPAYAFGLNPFQCDDPDDDHAVAHTLDAVMQAFARLWGSSMWETPLLADYLRNTATMMILSRCTMVDLARMIRPTEVKFRNERLASLPRRYGYLREFWIDHDALLKREKDERLGSLSRRVRTFTDNPITRSIFSQQRSSIEWREVMDRGRIVLVALDPNLEWLSTFIGSLMIGQLFEAATSRSNATQMDRTPFALYVDEYQKVATPAMAALLKGGRKFGMMTTVSHQVRADLDESTKAATAQVGNLIVFGVIGEDATLLAKQFKVDPKPREKVLKMVTTPVYEEWEVDVWSPVESQAKHAQWSKRARSLSLDITSLAWAFGSQGDTNSRFEKVRALANGKIPLYQIYDHLHPVLGSDINPRDKKYGFREVSSEHYRHTLENKFDSFNWTNTVTWVNDGPWQTKLEIEKWSAEGTLGREIEEAFAPYKQREMKLTQDTVGINCRHHMKYEMPFLGEMVAWLSHKAGELLKEHEEAVSKRDAFGSHRSVQKRLQYLYERPVRDAVASRTSITGSEQVNQYEWVDSPPRTVADVQNEIANLMATLPKLQALVRCIVGDDYAEYRMKAFPRVAGGKSWRPPPTPDPVSVSAPYYDEGPPPPSSQR